MVNCRKDWWVRTLQMLVAQYRLGTRPCHVPQWQWQCMCHQPSSARLAPLTPGAPQQLLKVLRVSWAGVCEALHLVLTVLVSCFSSIIKFTANWIVSASQRVNDKNHMDKQKAPQLWSWALVSACAGRESCHYIMMHLSKRCFVFWETDVPCSC